MATYYPNPAVMPLAYQRSKITVGTLLINAVGFLYVFFAWVVMNLPGLSRLCITTGLLLTAIVVAHSLVVGRLGFPRHAWIACLFLLFSSLTWVWAPDPPSGVGRLMMLWSSITSGLAIWCAAESHGLSWRTVTWAAVIGSLVIIASMLRQGGLSSAGRLAGVTGNPNQAAQSLVVAALMVWCIPLKLPRWLRIGVSGFVVYAFLATGSRKLILMIVGIVAMALLHLMARLRQSPIKLLLIGGPCLAVAFFVYALLVAGRTEELSESFSSIGTVHRAQAAWEGKEKSFAQRLDLLKEGWRIWSESPLWGHGPGQFSVLTTMHGLQSHNNQWELLANYGLIGFGLYYGLYLAFLRAAWRGAHRGSAPHRSALGLLALLVLIEIGDAHYFVKTTWILIPFIAYLVREDSPAANACVAARRYLAPGPWIAAPRRGS